MEVRNIKYSDDSVYFSASSKLPLGIPSGEIYETLNVGLVINKKTGLIEDTSITLLSDGAVRFLEYLIIGFNVHDQEIESLLEKIKGRYFGGSQKAICAAIKLAYERYKSYREF